MGAHGSGRDAALGAVLTDRPSAAGRDAPGAFYGRRKGKRLRTSQDELLRTLLPRLRVDPRDPLASFPHPSASLRLEIGFGGGEHLAAQARAHPQIAFIGCEPFVNGVAKLLAVIAREQLANIRIWDADATELIGALPPRSLAGVSLLYPDPWPKRRHRKRRFLSDRHARGLGARDDAGLRIALRHRHRRLRRMGLGTRAAVERLPMDRRAAGRLAAALA